MNKFVIDIETSDFERSRMSACIYCGDITSLTRDHVVAVSWKGYKRNYAKGDTVPACRECNSILGNKPLFSISSRANYIFSSLSKKYRSILNHPNWTDSELQEMSKQFQNTLKHRGNAKSFIECRIKHALLTTLDENDLVKVKQQTHNDSVKYKILSDLYKGYSYEEISSKFSIDIKLLKSMFRNKENFSILTLFKWEHGISFEKSIYKLIRNSQLNLNSDPIERQV